MTDRPILFSAPMIKALLAGSKTQTRRVLNPQPPQECSIHYMLGNESWLEPSKRTPLRHHWEAWRGPLYRDRPQGHLAGSFTATMRFVPGDRLYVREAHYLTDDGDHECVVYAADDDATRRHLAEVRDLPEYFSPALRAKHLKLRPGIHMHRWASRLTLTVVDVLVQALQEIGEADARAEGVLWVPGHGEITPSDLSADPGYANFLNCRQGYEILWDHLNADRGFGWAANPFVAAITFTVERRNIMELD